MADNGDVLRGFYDAVMARDMAKARTYLQADMVFEGLFETYPDADAYIETFTGLMSITTRLEVLAVIAQGEDVAVFFELETAEPAPAVTLVAEWHEVRDSRIYHARSAFDGRPFAAMFGVP
jgi:hypothetical protein